MKLISSECFKYYSVLYLSVVDEIWTMDGVELSKKEDGI